MLIMMLTTMVLLYLISLDLRVLPVSLMSVQLATLMRAAIGGLGEQLET